MLAEKDNRKPLDTSLTRYGSIEMFATDESQLAPKAIWNQLHTSQINFTTPIGEGIHRLASQRSSVAVLRSHRNRRGIDRIEANWKMIGRKCKKPTLPLMQFNGGPGPALRRIRTGIHARW